MSVITVKKNIKRILLTRKRAQLIAICYYYAAMALSYFQSVQPPKPDTQGKWWYNQTGQAALRVFTKIINKKNEVGWAIAHGVDYGVYLTLANDRKHDALLPIIKRFAGKFFNDVKRIMTG